MKKRPTARKESTVTLAPEVLWRPAEEASRRRGLVRVVELCGNPRCYCYEAKVVAYEIDESFYSVEPGPEKHRFRHEEVASGRQGALDLR